MARFIAPPFWEGLPPNLVAAMHTQVVQNKKYLRPGSRTRRTRNRISPGGRHRFPIEHETNFPLIGDRGNHVRVKSAAGHPLNRRLSYRRVTPAMLAITTDSRFVAPMNFCSFVLGALGDTRVTLFEPSLDQFRFLRPQGR